MDALPCPTVDTHHIPFDIILPFIRARYDRRMQAHRDTVDRMRNGECPECMNKYYDLWKDKRIRNTLLHLHFKERHDPVYRRAVRIEARAEVFRLTRLGRRLLHLHTHPNIHPDNLDWWPADFIRARYNRRAKAGRDAYAKIMDGQCPQCNAGLLAGNPPMPKFLNPSVFPNMVLYYHFVEETHDTAIPGLELSAIFVDWRQREILLNNDSLPTLKRHQRKSYSQFWIRLCDFEQALDIAIM